MKQRRGTARVNSGKPLPGAARNGTARSARENQRLSLELQVHQEELRQQNDELLRAQQELETARDRYSALYDLAPLPYLTLNQSGRVEEANETCLTFLGLPRDRLVGRSLFSFISRRLQGELRARFGSRRRGPSVLQTQIRAAGGESLVELHIRPTGNGLIYTAIVDLSERERSAAEKRSLLVQAEVARAASAAKDQFLAALSHELRTPLTPVVMAVSGLEARLQRGPLSSAEIRDFVGMVHRNLDYETRLIDDLLDASRLAVGKLMLERQPTALHDVLRDAVALTADEARRKGVPVNLELRARRPQVDGDAMRLRQVFWNLLRNAIKFNDRGGTVTVTSRNDRDVIAVDVRDTGVGITALELGVIFDRFSQTTAGQRAGGLGIGLAIVRGIVEAHGGRVTAHSAGPGRGAVFTVELATQRATARDAAATFEPAQASEPPVSGRRILLVEDHDETATILAQLLRGQGFQVDVAHTVEEALAAATRGLDLLISDLGLPDGSGVELLSRLRPRFDVPAIALTGYGQEDDVARSRAAGFAQHLVKPVTFPNLLRAIQQLDPRAGQ
jgi:PAS domain S-box-containing protein